MAIFPSIAPLAKGGYLAGVNSGEVGIVDSQAVVHVLKELTM